MIMTVGWKLKDSCMLMSFVRVCWGLLSVQTVDIARL